MKTTGDYRRTGNICHKLIINKLRVRKDNRILANNRKLLKQTKTTFKIQSFGATTIMKVSTWAQILAFCFMS